MFYLLSVFMEQSSYRQYLLHSDVSKNRLDLDNTVGQTCGHASDDNGRVKINGAILCVISVNTI